MHTHSTEPWQHLHVFLGEKHEHYERRTWLVVALTAATMVIEVVGGTIFGSMAVVADGVHMSTHVAALSIAALAYWVARRHAANARFAFGTGKVGDLAGFSSAIILALIGLMILAESALRLVHPVPIQFGETAAIASVGLAVNLASAWLLFDEGHHHHHGHADHGEAHHAHHHGHGHGHGHGHAHDHNLRAAYFHVLADAMTSLLAIFGLLTGYLFGWIWMDPLVGIIGAFVILSWTVTLIRASGAVLLDRVPNASLEQAIRRRLEVAGDRVTDLHLWQLGPGHSALIAAIVSDHPQPPEAYKTRLAGIAGLSHVTVEVHPCPAH
jgi:cation diffusion facilitator family transporter